MKILYEQENYKAARDKFIKIEKQYSGAPPSAQALFMTGQTFLQTGDYKSAGKYFSRAREISDEPRLEQKAVLGLCRILIHEQQYQTAMQRLNQVVNQGEIDINAEAQFLLGEVYRGQNDLRAAAVAYLKVNIFTAVKPAGPCGRSTRPRGATRSLGRLDDAKRLYHSILQDYPDFNSYTDKARMKIKELANL
ncbi:MAG: tetratricopeptide repeat protein [candidate division KSB1 bacterium]|nr:tetratricopeptide repeat protein [candidate division KSB1 bacterium]